MTNLNCPPLVLISQWIDDELSTREEIAVRTHIATCPHCTQQIQRLQQQEHAIRTHAHQMSAPPEPALTAECLSPTIVVDYLLNMLAADVATKVEAHLASCNRCLSDVHEAAQMQAMITSRTSQPVPRELKTKVAAAWEPAARVGTVATLSQLVIQASRRGLELIEHHVVAPIVDIQQMLVPMPAYRAEQTPQTLDVKIDAGAAEIQATVYQEGDGVSVQMTFLSKKLEAVTGQRVFLRQNGRSIFSSRTDNDGQLRTPHLQPGTYEVSCAGLDTTFQLELRS